MITDQNLHEERVHPFIGGVQRIYKPSNGYYLSAINSPRARAYPFAWEVAVLGSDLQCNYDTPLTNDTEVFDTDEEANAFISRAIEWASTPSQETQ